MPRETEEKQRRQDNWRTWSVRVRTGYNIWFRNSRIPHHINRRAKRRAHTPTQSYIVKAPYHKGDGENRKKKKGDTVAATPPYPCPDTDPLPRDEKEPHPKVHAAAQVGDEKKTKKRRKI